MKVEKIKIPNNKGKNIAAVIHYPEIKTEQLAIICPGYLDSKDYNHLVKLAEALTEHGYVSVRFDPTGTGESEGDISEYLTSQYLEDVKSTLEYMLKVAKYSHVLLTGHSRGGMISILYASRDSRISEVVSIMPSSPKTIQGKRYDDWETKRFAISTRDIPNTTEKREYRVPYTHVIDRMKFNVFEEVKNLHVPIVLVAGELDTIVLPEHVKEIFDLAHEPKKLILMKGFEHGYRHDPLKISQVNEKILEAIT
jgi:alpha-beta hydrolase superfamily lysophospholipase